MARSSSKPTGPSAPERDYSHRSLLDKLGVKPGHTIAVIGIDDPLFLSDLRSRVPGFFRGTPLKGTDVVLFSAEGLSDLARLKSLVNTIDRNGAIWVVYPKGESHTREGNVILAGKAARSVDNKVRRFSDTHTALRFVIPLAKR